MSMLKAPLVLLMSVVTLCGCETSSPKIDLTTPGVQGSVGTLALELELGYRPEGDMRVTAYLVNVSDSPVMLPEWVSMPEHATLAQRLALYIKDENEWVYRPAPAYAPQPTVSPDIPVVSFSSSFVAISLSETPEAAATLLPGERDWLFAYAIADYVDTPESQEFWCTLLFPYVFDGDTPREAGILLRSNVVSLTSSP